MAVWCLIRTIFSDPGFVPKGYSYNPDEMNPADATLLRFVLLNRDSRFLNPKADDFSNAEELNQIRRLATFQITIPGSLDM